MSASPSILFTNLLLGGRTGSELHVLELAQSFSAAGWDVTCYTLVVAYPLQLEFNKANVKLVEYGNEDQLEQKYDVLFTQHHVVSDYLLSNHDIAFKYLIASVLGAEIPHEFPPHFAKHADLIICNSGACVDWCKEVVPEYQGSYQVLPNYADSSFFDMAHIANDNVHNIAVISNHVQEELFELAEIVPDDVHIDYFGTQTYSVDVTPDLLNRYDIIITIGRTVLYAMAGKVPVYCYDRFGGPGYMAPLSIEEHAHKNFSGKSVPYKRTATELWRDILEGYSDAVANLDELRQCAAEHYSYDKLFESLLSHVSAQVDTHEYRTLVAFISPETKNTSAMLVASTKNGQASKFGTAQCRVRGKDGETKIISFRYRYSTRITFESFLEEGDSLESFKPTNTPCICTVYTPGLRPSNEMSTTPGNEEGSIRSTFLTAHPTYTCDGHIAEIQFHVERYKGATIKLWSLYNKARKVGEDYEARCEDYEARCKKYELDIERLERANAGLAEDLGSAKKSVDKTKRELRTTKRELADARAQMQSLKWTLGHTVELTRKRIRKAFSRKAR